MKAGFPPAFAGMTVGLLGGSFDPAHEGHAHLTREALKRLGLDRVWWLVSPGNPLKERPPAPMEARLARARRIMRHPRVVVTDIEARLGTRYTADTIAHLQALYPGVRFVWIMGADNLAGFHRWERWRDIMARVPVAVLSRPGAGLQARFAPVARAFAAFRCRYPSRLARRRPPCWMFLSMPMIEASSSAIRARGGWKAGEHRPPAVKHAGATDAEAKNAGE